MASRASSQGWSRISAEITASTPAPGTMDRSANSAKCEEHLGDGSVVESHPDQRYLFLGRRSRLGRRRPPVPAFRDAVVRRAPGLEAPPEFPRTTRMCSSSGTLILDQSIQFDHQADDVSRVLARSDGADPTTVDVQEVSRGRHAGHPADPQPGGSGPSMVKSRYSACPCHGDDDLGPLRSRLNAQPCDRTSHPEQEASQKG